MPRKNLRQGRLFIIDQEQQKPRIKKFLNSGGDVVDQALLTPNQLADIYLELFERRWGVKPDNKQQMVDMITSLRDMIFGYVLFYNGQPCAFQFITRADSPKWICFDYVNGGYDREQDGFVLEPSSPG